jgi:hypothetical protein
MDIESNRIPNLQIENIGSKKKPHNVIKGYIELPCWNGYYLYDDTYKLIKDKVVTGGRIELWVDGEIASDNSLQFLPEQFNAYFYLVQHQERIKHSILQGLKQEFPRLLSHEYASWEHEDPYFPKLADLTTEFDFKNYIGPESISIGEDVKDGSAYITWRFRCSWDVEHGLDFVTHKERVIEVAQEADPWKIYKDNGTYEQELQEYKAGMPVFKPAKQKKWWQFW